jgi:hypothetical protein|tara:strand:- start:831 stop:944 length:114 start_codon:yes stop_codon:yes gene_type:complete
MENDWRQDGESGKSRWRNRIKEVSKDENDDAETIEYV